MRVLDFAEIEEIARLAQAGGRRVTISEIIAVRAALIEMSGGAAHAGDRRGEFDIQALSLMLAIRAERVAAIFDALTLVNGRFAAACRAALLRPLTSAERTARWRARHGDLARMPLRRRRRGPWDSSPSFEGASLTNF